MPHEPAAKPRFLDELRQAALQRFGRPNAPERIVESTRRFIVFHDKRHPRELGATEIHRFFGHVARSEKDPLRCLENCHEAMTFLHQDFLRINVGELRIPEPPRLLDRLRWAIRVRHYSPHTEECYVGWVERFIRFHRMRHPNTMGGAEIEHVSPNFIGERGVLAVLAPRLQVEAGRVVLREGRRYRGADTPRSPVAQIEVGDTGSLIRRSS